MNYVFNNRYANKQLVNNENWSYTEVLPKLLLCRASKITDYFLIMDDVGSVKTSATCFY